MAEKRSAKDQAMRYLEYRARTVSEVRSHLIEKEYPEEEIADCLEFLRDCHFVDDEAYLQRYIEYSIEKGRGPLRIRQELGQKGIPPEQIELGLEALYDRECQRETALRQAEKALGINREASGTAAEAPEAAAEAFGTEEEASGTEEKTLSEKELARAARRLSGQGFGGSVVHDVLSQLRRRGNFPVRS